jgi:hypothetical protein
VFFIYQYISQLSINPAQNQLAFSTDSGTVGVVDLSSKRVNRMKKKHDSVHISIGHGIYHIYAVHRSAVALSSSRIAQTSSSAEDMTRLSSSLIFLKVQYYRDRTFVCYALISLDQLSTYSFSKSCITSLLGNCTFSSLYLINRHLSRWYHRRRNCRWPAMDRCQWPETGWQEKAKSALGRPSIAMFAP